MASKSNGEKLFLFAIFLVLGYTNIHKFVIKSHSLLLIVILRNEITKNLLALSAMLGMTINYKFVL